MLGARKFSRLRNFRENSDPQALFLREEIAEDQFSPSSLSAKVLGVLKIATPRSKTPKNTSMVWGLEGS